MTTLETGPRPSSATAMEPGRSRHGGGRWWRRVAVAVVLVLVVGHAGAGWYLSRRIIDEFRISGPSPVEYDATIVLVEDGRITLERSEAIEKLEADPDAVMGLTWDGGYGQIGPALSFDGPTEVRELTVLDGTPPSTGVDVADVHSFAFSTDPGRVGFAYETVTYPAPLGELEGWLLPGERETWIVGVHGRNADRHEFLRLVDVTAELGYPTLLRRYRNDPGSPSSDGSLILVGQEEWRTSPQPSTSRSRTARRTSSSPVRASGAAWCSPTCSRTVRRRCGERSWSRPTPTSARRSGSGRARRSRSAGPWATRSSGSDAR
jgi:hypothetical protein